MAKDTKRQIPIIPSEDGSENSFYDCDPPVLVNKLGLRDRDELRAAEKESHKRVERVPATLGLDLKQGLTCDALKVIHAHIFGGIYEWAGRWRTVNIELPGAKFANAQFLDDWMRQVEDKHLRKHPPSELTNDDKLCRALAEIHGEVIAAHPFRDGNGRTTRMACSLLAAATGRCPAIEYDESAEGRAKYIEASRLAYASMDYRGLEEIFREGLARYDALAQRESLTLKQDAPANAGVQRLAEIGDRLSSQQAKLNQLIAQASLGDPLKQDS